MNISPVEAGAVAPYFILSKIVPAEPKNKKLPCNSNGEVVSLHEAQRMTREECQKLASIYGPQYRPAVILNGDGRFCIDIDGCLQADNTWSPLATELCGSFPGAYVEISQSGRGLHIFGSGANLPDHRCKNIPLGIELYTTDRFICIGQDGQGNMTQDCSAPLNAIVARYFTADEAHKPSEWTTTHCAGSYPIEEDDKLIAKALEQRPNAAAIFSNKATFSDLWYRNVSVLRDAFPDDEREYDGSSADAALAQHLAFWTGNNCERIERLMRMSALVREKWEKHKSYMFRTITNAVGRQASWYSVGAPIPIVRNEQVIESGAPVVRSGFQFLGVSQVVDHFKGCVYVAESHRVFTPNGQMLKSEQFNAMYGGYLFTMDESHDKTTKKAWEAFTENQAISFPKVDRATFRPDLDAGVILKEDGLSVVNTYIPVTVKSTQGDVSRFLEHMRRNLPDPNDRQILLSYMAALVQHKGVKFKWAPLIQGVEGNGKTLYTACVMAAIGERYSHMPPAQEIGEKFNAWLFDKIFIGVEDIYVPEQKLELIETLKPMITGERLAKRAMQQDQTMQRLCANFIFNSNHKNAVRKTANDRRFAIFYTNRQTCLLYTSPSPRD